MSILGSVAGSGALPRPLRGMRTRARRLERHATDARSHVRFAERIDAATAPIVLVRHASLLRRRLGDTDPALQDTKVVNLRLAVAGVDGLRIAPSETFSFWHAVGRPSAERGFQSGLVLSGGRISTGIGGGLCQLSNLLYWMALHTPLEVAEHHHHSFDPFPDDRRVLPFGSGASVCWDLVDLRLRNPTDLTLQLAVRVADTQLVGAVRADLPWPFAYHVVERGHAFIETPDGVHRRNELWRRTVDRRTGRLVAEVLLTRNDARVGYPVRPEGAPPAPDA